MLPFLNPKKLATIVKAKHTKDGPVPQREEGGYKPEAMEAAEHLLRGIAAKDAATVAQALQDHMFAYGPEGMKDEA